jgi:hypothetical protein
MGLEKVDDLPFALQAGDIDFRGLRRFGRVNGTEAIVCSAPTREEDAMFSAVSSIAASKPGAPFPAVVSAEAVGAAARN